MAARLSQQRVGFNCGGLLWLTESATKGENWRDAKAIHPFRRLIETDVLQLATPPISWPLCQH